MEQEKEFENLDLKSCKLLKRKGDNVFLKCKIKKPIKEDGSSGQLTSPSSPSPTQEIQDEE